MTVLATVWTIMVRFCVIVLMVILCAIGLEYPKDNSIRSCCGCLTYVCQGEINPEHQRMEYFWSLKDESNIDQRCCINCEGKCFPEGSVMGERLTKGKENCTTEVQTSCIYNPGDN